MRRFLFAVPFLLGAIAVVWIAATFLSNPVALTVTLIIAAAYTLGFAELLRFRRTTATLDRQLEDLPDSRDGLNHWLKALPGSLRHAVQRRIDGHPAPLPGPQLTPYLTGLLVMLGLLGTFVGMIVTLQGAATALDGSSELTAIRSALAAPIAGLSLAFGTSIAGVAASAMLGLSAALCRRDRMAVSRKLDDRVDLLHAFSLDHQRQSAYSALQDQSRIFPELVSALQGLTGRMEQMGEQLSDSLTRNQQDFHHTLTDQYRTLAESVSQSLKETLADSSRLAVENIQPIMEQSLAGLSQQVQGTHERLNAITEKQLATLTERFRETTEAAAQHWQQGLDQHQQTSARLVSDISTSLAAHHDQFRDNSSQLLEQVRSTQAELGNASEQQLAAIAEQFRSASEQALQQWQQGLAEQKDTGHSLLQEVRDTQQQLARTSEEQLTAITGQFRAVSEQAAAHWRDGIDAQQASGATLISELRSALSEHNQQFQTSAAGLLDGQKSGIDTLVATVREELVALRDAEAGRSEAASERLAQLEGTVSEHLGRLGTALEAPMTRLIETASETPKAAAEVISRLREEMTRSSERDNELLEERRRIMAELDTLLSSQRDAAGAQREAIETLITAASDTLTQVSDTFAQQVSAQSEQLDQVAGDVAGSAAEVASLSDAFATAVQVFSEANDKLLDNLQQVESRLEQSSARADEQLNYYVEQAREVIELSMASQKEVIDALGTLNGAGKNVAQSEERPASEVN
ncbi:DUF802 domain-containing protein [Alcanivorax sp.]|uniref:DUF802 domain-containing protein n=1 Tax=Alcanivorax sp. TaxID=1872427 RepID=UPI0025C52894|nr:DUF802 domain-containing protein [Alcanivorax sp.]